MLAGDNSGPQLGFRFEEAVPSRRIWPVRELVAGVRSRIERDFGDVWVEGEISNCRPAPSGHVYFTLKDAEAQLPAVLFRRQAALLRFRPEDGLHVLVRGRASVYEQRGQLQLIAETMEPVGTGSLQLAFEQLKQRLQAEGLFEAARKKPLPAFPRTVGVITSPTGAVIRDFLNIAGRRHSGLNILLFPVSVQGEAAIAEIEAAFDSLNRMSAEHTHMVDLIVLARGGGSLEDLAAFNSEQVARAIGASDLPVISAIGHETDFTIADFVADMRAPTPSAAAELVTEAHHRVAARLAMQEHRLDRAVRFQLLQARQHFAHMPVGHVGAQVLTMLHRKAQRLDDLGFRSEGSLRTQVRARRERVNALSAIVLRHDPRHALGKMCERLLTERSHLHHAMEHRLHRSVSALSALNARLRSLSPVAVLDRGYALVFNADGSLVRSAAAAVPGSLLTTRLADGSFISRVESKGTEAAKAHRAKRKL